MKGKKYDIKLPALSRNGYFEMRLDSIGGLGANLCGKMLGELGAEYFGFNSTAFSSYGSEKRGSAVKSYVRWCESSKEILHNSPIENPQLIAVFHEALVNTSPIAAGADEACIFIVNTDKSPDLIRDSLKLFAGTVCCIDALEISMKTKSRVNMVMLGAIAHASGFIPIKPLEEIVTDSLGAKYPDLLKNNLSGLKAGYNGVTQKHFHDDGKFNKIPYSEAKSSWGYINAPIGGANPNIGSTFSNELSASREGYIPLFIQEKCIHCGLCDITCPDMVFQFIPGEFKGKKTNINTGLDYHHCKGCLRCVEICPSGALVSAKETDYPEKPYFVRNKDLIRNAMDYEAAGADASVTGESYLREKRPDGGQI